MRLFRPRRGQATTEVVLLVPMFMFFLFAFAKVFSMLVLIQKMEIASYYAARRWQLESHRNIMYEGWDRNELRGDILKKVNSYLGFDSPGTKSFLDLTNDTAELTVERTQVWNIVTLKVNTKPVNLPYMTTKGYEFVVTKYVPNRDRPIAFVLPGLQ